jgi:phage shock protein E
MTIDQIIKEGKATIVDVRTPGEFMGGHVAGSINIPLNEVPSKIEQFRKMTAPVVLCCASGNRSGQATHFLSNNGIDCVNGGSWLDVNYLMSTTA